MNSNLINRSSFIFRSNYNFNDTSDIAKREYEKLYTRLSRKYSGKELEYKIKEKLYQKGLSYEKDY